MAIELALDLSQISGMGHENARTVKELCTLNEDFPQKAIQDALAEGCNSGTVLRYERDGNVFYYLQ